MPQYSYTAMNAHGKEIKGKINAASEEAAILDLKAKGLFPTSIKAAAAVVAKKKKGSGFNMALGPIVVKKKDLTVFTRQLAILLDAGLPLIRSLRTLEKQSKDANLKIVLGQTADTVEGGATFAESLAQNP